MYLEGFWSDYAGGTRFKKTERTNGYLRAPIPIAPEMQTIHDCFGRFFMLHLSFGSCWPLLASSLSNSHGWSSSSWLSFSISLMCTVTRSVIKMPKENGQLGLLHNQHLELSVAALEVLLEKCSLLVSVACSLLEVRVDIVIAPHSFCFCLIERTLPFSSRSCHRERLTSPPRNVGRPRSRIRYSGCTIREDPNRNSFHTRPLRSSQATFLVHVPSQSNTEYSNDITRAVFAFSILLPLYAVPETYLSVSFR